ncbi:MAG TPA: PPOX class F420-dependent oxidoreductase [Pilimelia sp.]|nr:PPOX class F420-dependent oxidoreductase [Pilimelia sp.]
MTTFEYAEPAQDVERLLSSAAHAVVGVNRADQPPQLSVVWFLWDGETFRFSTTRSRAKFRNLRRDPSISVLIDDFDRKFHVVAYGEAELIEGGHAELAQPLIEKYLPPGQTHNPQWTPDRVIVRFRPDRILTGR